MTVSCKLCDKQFANKRSLASHQSRFHRERTSEHDSNSSIHVDEDDGTSIVSTEKAADGISASDQASDVESTTSSNIPSSAVSQSPTALPRRNDHSGNYITKTNVRDQDSSPEYSKEKHSQMDPGKDYPYSSEDSDNDSETSIENSAVSDDWYSGVKRKAKVDVALYNNKLIKVLHSIESLLNRQSCKEEDDCFDLLFSYKLKKSIFAELADFFVERGLDIKNVLSEDELLFIDALLDTTNLADIRMLMNENSDMVKSILERHVILHGDKRQKYD